MMTKEEQIRVMIIPQLCRLVSHLWDNEYLSEGRRLDKIVEELTDILDEGDELK